MRTLRAVLVLAVVGLVTGGCLSIRSYVDPQLPKERL